MVAHETSYNSVQSAAIYLRGQYSSHTGEAHREACRRRCSAQLEAGTVDKTEKSKHDNRTSDT